MKFHAFSKLLSVLLVSSRALAQQAGTRSEDKPTITLKECTLAGGCTSRQAKLTLDANWRWIHKVGGHENCYTGNKWEGGICSDPATCAQQCALEGVSRQQYENTYGIKQVQDGVRLNFVTDHQYGTNVGSRLYVMEDDENYAMFHLKNREFSFEVDVSELYCGMNGAMYFTEMQANGGKGIGHNAAGAKYGTGYCDAQCPHDIKFIDGEANVVDWKPNPNDLSNNMGAGKYGACCAEMDIWEANSMASAFTPHTCSTNKLFRCSDPVECGDNASGNRYDGVCDKDGCDINPYRMGVEDFYGRGDEYAVNTLKPMTVVTQFLTTDGTDTGDFSEMRRLYIQNGKIVHSPPSTILGPGKDSDSITDEFCDAKKDLFGDVKDYQEHGGMKGMGESLDRGHAMIFSLWDDVEVNMLWLDSAYPLDRPVTDPGIKRGDCPGGETSTPTWLREAYPNGGVVFKNAAVGEIGSTYVPPAPLPTARPTEPPGCFSNNYKDCLPDTFSNETLSCNSVWLPNGPQQNCIALWEGCTGQGSSSCCGDAVCFGDDSHSACVPPPDSSDPTEIPTQEPTTPEPTPPACISCDDRETPWMIRNGFECDPDTARMDTKCNKDAKWSNKKFCRLSCYKSGNGYPGDVCCDESLSNGSFFSRKNLRTR